MQQTSHNAVALLVFDGRFGLPGPEELSADQSYPIHTIVELPFQRELVRNCASSRRSHIVREMIVEIDTDLDKSAICSAILQRAESSHCPVVITAANDLLVTTGLLSSLEEHLRRNGRQLVVVPGS